MKALRLYSASSLREAMTAVIAAYQAQGGDHIDALYGPAGKLREEIENGNVSDIFASAAMVHIEALLESGKLRSGQPFARNSMCVMAVPGLHIAPDKVIDLMLDPRIRLATSTPQADPSGDYAWQIFRNIDRLRPGAFAVLDAKALKLVGGQIEPTVTSSPLLPLVQERKADIFLSYCTSAVSFSRLVAGLTWVPIPDAINVSVVYGIGVTFNAPPEADAFVAFATGPHGRQILERHGFR